MSEKIKVNFEFKPEETEIQAGDTTVMVKKHIPMAEKLQMAQDWVETGVVINQKNGLLQQGHLWHEIEIYLAVKYYTNIDTEDATVEQVIDWASSSGISKKIGEIIEDDEGDVYLMSGYLFANIQREYERGHSLERAVMDTFGSILNGEDITETMANAYGMKEEMLDIVERLKNVSKQEPKMDNPGEVNVGGNIIQIGKKKI